MKKAIALSVVLIVLGALTWAGVAIYRSHHMMSHDVLVNGRLALQSAERAHALDGFARTLENDRGATLFHQAEANRANDSDKRALTALQNYETAIGYIQTFPNDRGFCGEHHCQQLYEVCKGEMKMFDDGFVPSASHCRDMAAEDK
jgi:hypothetical protein